MLYFKVIFDERHGMMSCAWHNVTMHLKLILVLLLSQLLGTYITSLCDEDARALIGVFQL